jgi:glucose/arabinose dehydrogenase
MPYPIGSGHRGRRIATSLLILTLVSAACRAGAPATGQPERDHPPDGAAMSAPDATARYEVGPSATPPSPPRFIQAHYLDPSAISRISRFRSGAGHDFNDGWETCRSMKHYLWPRGSEPGAAHDPAWTQLPIFAPVDGHIARVLPESWGTQLWLEPTSAPEFRVRIFHVSLAPGWREGDPVSAGNLLGYHASDETMSDVALEWQSADGSMRLLSYFDAMPVDLFQDLVVRGVTSPAMLSIDRVERDAAPLDCDGERFRSPSSPVDWVDLAPPTLSDTDVAAITARLAPKLKLERHAVDLPFPVALAWGPAPVTAPRPGEPVLYVATNGAAFPLSEDPVGAVWWLDGTRPRLFIGGLDRPLGLLWTGSGERSELLVSSRGRIAAWQDSDGDGQADAERLLVIGLPAFDQHQNDSLALGPDGFVFAGMGTAGNADEAVEAPLNGTLFRIPLAGGAADVYARGLRNPFDLAFAGDGRLWATDNGVDPPAHESAPDELNRIVKGGFYGHPSVFGLDAPDSAAQALAPRPPAAVFPAHASADGLLVYRGRLFPELRGRLLVAEFGSYQFSPELSGRRLVLVDPGAAGAEDRTSQAALIAPFPGRPLDLAEGPDGRIYIADFEGDTVWRLGRTVDNPAIP